jgi:uroporphyrinogen decarboxylase
MFDYSEIYKLCRQYRDAGYAVECGYISLSFFYSVIRGIEQMLVDFASDPELAEYILHKINEFAVAHTRRMLEEADGLADIVQITDDFGAQNGLLMSEAMIERYLGGYYEKNIAMARSYDVKIFHHDDGAVMDLIPWIVSKGCQVLNPIQWHLPGWDLHKLKTEYGKVLCFHGGIDNQDVLPFGTPDNVRAEVRACMDALYSDKTGYILAPCHNLQAITPVENVLTMYEYAKEYSGIFK